MPRKGNSTIYDVLESGPIVAKNEELGLIVSINGSYLNLWVSDGDGGWNNTDCRSGHPDLYELSTARAMELGEEWLRDIERGDESDDDEAEAESDDAE